MRSAKEPSRARCAFLREFLTQAVVAFASVYRSGWDGWGLWIKQQCIPKVVAPDEAERRRLMRELHMTVADIKAVLPYEPAGHVGRVGVLLVEATLLDQFLLGKGNDCS